ncbi:hypothetical protein O181_078753 [Austropuccinia psidii MF-1]|uniref:Uncharacterized protein n=1 Tax=Austropuccinia psidii MF-1 TaxID=1389203 RepID=A0A9Q3FJK0_9BASI|nr:hypothetical protein [Austropuccinia psidii MF-1]
MKMVHTRNGSNYSVQQDGCGQGRGKTCTRSANSSSRKTCLEDARVSPHYPRSVSTNFDINSKSELIQGNFLRAGPFPSGSHRSISIPVPKPVQTSQGRGVVNIPKPLEGGYKLLIKHQELSGSGEAHRTLKRIESIVFQRQGQKDKEFVAEPKSFIHRPEERIGNNLSFRKRRPSGINQLQTSYGSVKGQAQRTSEEAERSQEQSRKGKMHSQLAQTLPKKVQDPQIRAFSSGQCIPDGQNCNLIHIQRAVKDG